MIFAVSNDLPKKIHDAAEKANKFLENGLHVILGKDKFTYTEDSPEMVFNHLASLAHSDVVITVLPWKPFNRWTSAIATTFKNKPNEIYVNVRKIDQRSVRDYVNTMSHEFCHTPGGYGHGGNSPAGKSDSVPYWVGSQASLYFY
jgi:hypothetical protein